MQRTNDQAPRLLELASMAVAASLLLFVACRQPAPAWRASTSKDASPETQVSVADASPEAPWLPPPPDAPSTPGPEAPAGSFCGDGTVDRNEECDDGNTSPGDGCSATCVLEDPGPCNGCVPSRRRVCGNGLLSEDELCDDGNSVSGDGCAADCRTVEPGWRCRVPSRRCTPICGDLVLTGTETCDDGNTVGDDGCSMHCLTEPGWDCALGVCTRTVVDGGSGSDGGGVPTCGDGVQSGAEECDLGAAGNSDTEYGGCTTHCWYGSFCGDGVVNGPEGGEACDLGRQNGLVFGPDGCTLGCTRPHYCGDGIVDIELREECDFGERNGLYLDKDRNPTDPGTGVIYCRTDCVLPSPRLPRVAR